VPFPPGGTSDVIARLITKPLGDALNTTVVVENKTGANGAIGAAAVAQSNDEHSMLLSDMSSLAINAIVTKELPYKPAQLAGATMLAYSPHLLCTHPSIAANNLRELAALSRTKPLNIASSGIGSANHLGAAEIALAMDMKFVHVPFRGGAPAIQAVIGGQVDCSFDGAARPFIASGAVRALATTGSRRDVQYPAVPTFDESGFAGFDMTIWQGLFAPAQLPADIAARLRRAVHDAAASPAVVEQARSLGLNPLGGGAAELEKLIAAEVEKYQALTRQLRIAFD